MIGAAPAAATSTVDCEAADGGASLSLLIGSLPVLNVLRLEITVGEASWSTEEGGGEPIRIGQAFRDGERWLIDATDPNVEDIVAEVRLTGASEGPDTVLAGTLRIAGKGAFAVSCIGP